MAERELRWVGASKRDFPACPMPVISEMGYALGVAQPGGNHPHAKPWQGGPAGVFEIVESYDGQRLPCSLQPAHCSDASAVLFRNEH
ncbi:MAG: hypothetical protein Q8M47_09970 [Devosia sp.]|nr:hypothetical protein [Devosia sp.]